MDKSRYKMFKKGKQWCVIALVIVTTTVGLGVNAQTILADVNTQTQNTEIDANSSANDDGTVNEKAGQKVVSSLVNPAGAQSNSSKILGSEDTDLSSSEFVTDNTSQNKNDEYTGENVSVAKEDNTAQVDGSEIALKNSGLAESSQQNYHENRDINKVVKVEGESTPKNGWFSENGQRVFYSNGLLANGYEWSGADSTCYLFKNGIRLSDVQKWAGTYYYFDHNTYQRVDDKYVQSNWGMWYLFGDNGQIATDVQKWAGTYYYFDHYSYLMVKNNYVGSNWGSWYLFGDDGKIVTDVQKWAGTYYYFDHSTYLRVDNSYVQSNWGLWYMFGNNGQIVSGFSNWKGSTYYFNPSTYLKQINLAFIKESIYYFGNSGQLRRGYSVYGKTELFSDNSGKVYEAYNSSAPIISQLPSLPTGCEATAVAMLLQYAGISISKEQVANETLSSSNPNTGFVGNPYSRSSGWVLASGIESVIRRNIGTSELMNGDYLDEIKYKLTEGHLVAAWLGNINGFSEHCVTLTGFSNSAVKYNNPWTGKSEVMSWSDFRYHWNLVWNNALSY